MLRIKKRSLLKLRNSKKLFQIEGKLLRRTYKDSPLQTKARTHKIKDKECKRRKLREELKTLEDYLDDYIKTTKTILEKIESELKKKEKLH